MQEINIPKWSELPPELLQVIAGKQTNYVDYIHTRAVCKSWLVALPKRPPNLHCQLPFLLLPYHKENPGHRGLYNISDDTTYFLELSEAYEKRCCGSSNGWLIMVEAESPVIFLLNPLTKDRIKLPLLSTFPTFPTEVVFENSRNLNENFIRREKVYVRDSFIVKAILSDDPLLNKDFTVMVIFGSSKSLAFCKEGDQAWTLINETSPPMHYKDVTFQAGKFYVVDQMGHVSICNPETNPTSPTAPTLVADPPAFSQTGYKQWYLANFTNDLLLIGRYRKFVPEYEFKTDKFEVYKLDLDRASWLKMENLGDNALFLGCNSSLSISALDNPNCKANCIYFTDDYMRINRDYIWEGHDFGVFDFSDCSIRSLSLPSYPIKKSQFINIYHFELSLYRDKSLFLLPPPVWVTVSL